MEAAFATIEIADSIATMGVHESAQARGYALRIAQLIERLQDDVTAPGQEFHEVTAIADKLAVAGLVDTRLSQNGNQVVSSILEQQLARNLAAAERGRRAHEHGAQADERQRPVDASHRGRRHRRTPELEAPMKKRFMPALVLAFVLSSAAVTRAQLPVTDVLALVEHITEVALQQTIKAVRQLQAEKVYKMSLRLSQWVELARYYIDARIHARVAHSQLVHRRRAVREDLPLGADLRGPGRARDTPASR